MKKVAVLLIFLLLIYFLLPNNNLSNEENAVFQIVDVSANAIKKKHHLQPTGHGVSMPGGPLRELHLIFDTNDATSKDELRKMLISSVSEVVQLVNSNPEIFKILFDPPFNYKNVGITIFNHDKNGHQIYDPEIAVARILNGKLSYSTIDRPDYSTYKNTTEETYEEALEIINGIPPLKTFH